MFYFMIYDFLVWLKFMIFVFCVTLLEEKLSERTELMNYPHIKLYSNFRNVPPSNEAYRGYPGQYPLPGPQQQGQQMPARPPYGPQQQQQLQPAPSPQIPQHAQPAGPVPNQTVVPPTPVATSAQQQQQPHVAPPTIASSNSQPTTGTHPPGQGPPGQQQQPGPNQMPGMPPAAGPNAGAPNPNYPPGPPQNQPDYYRNEQVKFTFSKT